MTIVDSGAPQTMAEDGESRALIIAHLGHATYVTRLLLKRLLQGSSDDRIDADRYLFRTAGFVDFFANLACFMLITGGRTPPRGALGTSARVGLIYDGIATWLHDGLIAGRLALPPVNDPRGIIFVSVFLDIAERHLASIAAHDLADRIAVLRAKVEVGLLRSESEWMLSSTYLRHVGHVVYASVLIELQRRGRIVGPPLRVVDGPSPNATLRALLAPCVVGAMPPGIRYLEMTSDRKRHLRFDGRLATMSESVSEAASIWAQEQPFAELPDSVREQGDAALLRLGVPPGAPIVTLHVRDEGYNDHIVWEMGLRDSNVDDYGAAVACLAERGITVVRLGDPGMRRATPRPGLIHYPFSEAKSDVLDVYLAARCRFHIGTSSGMSFVPLLFGRPVLMTNWITPAHMICAPSVLTLPKLLLDRDGRLVPIAVWCDRYRGLLERPDAELHGLSVRDNDPEDIREAVEFMDRAIDAGAGRPVFPPGLFAAQQAVFAASPLRIRPQIPPSFWRRHYA